MLLETLVRWLCRILLPNHTRGWLDYHAVWEDEADPPRLLWVHCHGMERWGLPNVEMVDVPEDLRGYAHGIMLEIVGYMKREKPIGSDEHGGGLLVAGDQRGYHQFTARAAPPRAVPDHDGMLRIVDYEEPVKAGFPHRLMAMHLCAVADTMKRPSKQEPLYRRSVEISPGEPAQSLEDKPKEGGNPGNALSWEGLGNCLCELGRVEEGLRCVEEAVARFPSWAREFQKGIRKEVAAMPGAPEDPWFQFWLDLDIPAVYAAARAPNLA